MDEILHLKNTGRKDYFYEEAIKTLRTNIQFCGSGLKTIMFTSSMPDEGKKRDGVCPGILLWKHRQEGTAGGCGHPQVRHGQTV